MLVPLSRDLNIPRKWVRCVRKSVEYSATYWNTGAIYYNRRTQQMTKATHATPIILRDNEGNLSTISYKDFHANYVDKDGKSLEGVKIEAGDVLEICTKSVGMLWAFHASTDVYGYDCGLGVNKQDLYNGSGDYIVCSGEQRPDISTAVIVNDIMFRELYEVKEVSHLFGKKNSRWTWNDVEYRETDDALRALCSDITWGPDSMVPKFGDLGMMVPNQLLMLVCIYNHDMASIFQSYNAYGYTQLTRGQRADILKAFPTNPLKVSNVRVPMIYESNKAMQCAIIPKLKEVYESEHIMLKVAGGKSFTFEKVLSYMCDTILFNPKDTPFKEILDVFGVLEGNEATKNLVETCTHRDLMRLKILAMQIKAGDIPEQDPISIGDVRACRYRSLTRDKLGDDTDYVGLMINSAPALHADSYEVWLKNAVDIKDAVDSVVETEPEVEEPVEEQETSVPAESGDEPIVEEPKKSEPEDVNVEHKEDIFASAMNTPVEEITETEVVEEPEERTKRLKKDIYNFLNLPIEETQEDKDVQEMRNMATVYCSLCDQSIEDCEKMLRSFGIETFEDLYRAIPVYLRRRFGKVEGDFLTEYCRVLRITYGSCELRWDA